MRSPNAPYLPAVDHLRAFAAVLVLVYHGFHVIAYNLLYHKPFAPDHWFQPSNPLLAALAEGHTGVALFMVLSGFILTHIAQDRPLDIGRFFTSRLLRTYPLFLLLLGVALAAHPEAFSLRAFVQTLLALGNMPGALDIPPFTGLTWTIAVEWQFYLLFPVLLLALRHQGARWAAGLIAILILSRLAAVEFGGSARDLSYMSLLGRLDQFLLGMVAAQLVRPRSWTRVQGGAVALVALGVLIVVLAAFNAAGGYPLQATWKTFWPTVEGLLWAAFILGYIAFAGASKGLLPRALAAVGTVSYSVYLTHFLLIQLMLAKGWVLTPTGRPLPDALLTSVVLVLPLCLMCATLTYHCIEKPFLSLRRAYHRSTPAVA